MNNFFNGPTAVIHFGLLFVLCCASPPQTPRGKINNSSTVTSPASGTKTEQTCEERTANSQRTAEQNDDAKLLLEAALMFRDCGLKTQEEALYHRLAADLGVPATIREKAIFSLATNALNSGHRDKARRLLDETFIERLDGVIPQITYLPLILVRATLLIEDGDNNRPDAYEKAEQLLLDTLAADPDSVPVLFLLALNRIHQSRLAEHSGQLNLAIIGLEQALKIQPDEPLFHYALGLAFLAQGEQNRAFQSVETALELNPDFFDALLLYGRMNIEIGDAQSAVSRLQSAVELRPDSYWAHYLLGLAFRLSHNADAARKQLQLAHQLDPTQLLDLFSLALLELEETRNCEDIEPTAYSLLNDLLKRANEAKLQENAYLQEIAARSRKLLRMIGTIDCIKDAEKEMQELMVLQQEAENAQIDALKKANQLINPQQQNTLDLLRMLEEPLEEEADAP